MNIKPYQGILLLLTVALLTWGMSFFPHSSSMAESCRYHEEAYQGLNLSTLSTELENTGLLGEIHGAANPSQLYVLSVREPNNFFKFENFSLIAANNETKQTLAQVKRHDQVCLKGRLIDNPSPQPHILVESVKITDSWSGLEKYPDYQYTANIPEELQNKTSFVGKVHAISNQGKILVVEYKDGILPIFVRTPKLTESLYRGDLIRLNYQIQSRPDQPTHLQLNTNAKPPIEIVDRLADRQGQEETLTGNLIKFPKSPQLKFDVYGMEVMTEGISRYFTLVNFEDIQEFESIRTKLAQIWDNHLDTIKTGRNVLINPQITIKAQGKINIVSPQQANPQILLESADKIQKIN